MFLQRNKMTQQVWGVNKNRIRFQINNFHSRNHDLPYDILQKRNQKYLNSDPSNYFPTCYKYKLNLNILLYRISQKSPRTNTIWTRTHRLDRINTDISSIIPHKTFVKSFEGRSIITFLRIIHKRTYHR